MSPNAVIPGAVIPNAYMLIHVNPTPLRRQLVQRRVAVGLSQEELGEAAGSGQSAISRLESGVMTLSVDWVERLVGPLRARVVIDRDGSRVEPDEVEP
jgi:predicted transcriptional regulator